MLKDLRCAKKNAEQSWVPVAPELQAYLDGLDRRSLNIATRADGTPWTSEKEMQTAVSHYLRRLERDGLIGAGTTLHGLRVSYAGQSSAVAAQAMVTLLRRLAIAPNGWVNATRGTSKTRRA